MDIDLVENLLSIHKGSIIYRELGIETSEQLFWTYTDTSDYQNEYGCWLWYGPDSRNPNYGSFNWENVNTEAHVFSWKLTHHQRIPDGYVVHHSCGIPKCVRPDHLFLLPNSDHLRIHMYYANLCRRKKVREFDCLVFVHNNTLERTNIEQVKCSYPDCNVNFVPTSSQKGALNLGKNVYCSSKCAELTHMENKKKKNRKKVLKENGCIICGARGLLEPTMNKPGGGVNELGLCRLCEKEIMIGIV